jgi:hypothetical protein
MRLLADDLDVELVVVVDPQVLVDGDGEQDGILVLPHFKPQGLVQVRLLVEH